MDAVLARLEGVACRLEAAEARLSSSSSAGPLPRPAEQTNSAANVKKAAAPAAAQAQTALTDWDTFTGEAVASFQQTAHGLGDEVEKATAILVKAFQEERRIVEAIMKCQAPDVPGLQQLLAPVAAQLGAIDGLTRSRRAVHYNHIKAVAETLSALSWVAYTGPSCGMSLPPQHAADAWQSAEFFANKLLMEHRGKAPAHVEWVKALKEVAAQLHAYLCRHFPKGPQWNASGIPLAAFSPSAPGLAAGPPPAEPAPAAKPAAPQRAGPPAPPPPPPGGPGSLLKTEAAPTASVASAAPATGMSAVFADLNKGEGVTSGLRKVTADMKTKNRADRGGAVPAAASQGGTRSGARGAGPGPRGPPRLECEQGRKWVVENFADDPNVLVEHTNPKQAVYIFGCVNCTIQVRGKVNAVTVDACARCGIVLDDLVASAELVNCAGVRLQVTGTAPTLAVDKCDGVQLYLSAAALGLDITTAKSSEVNVAVPVGDGGEFVEHALPEQFLSRFENGRFVTTPVSHGGG